LPWSGRNGARGFTLIELLVVIAIIALLISILLPALGEVRRQGKIIVCRSNIRQMAIAFVSYANENKEAVAGSPTTSGHAALKGVYNGTAMQTWDYLGPLLEHLGSEQVIEPEGTYNDQADASRADRLNFYREGLKSAVCPENNILAKPFQASTPWTTGRMLSYVTSTQFTSIEVDPPEGAGDRLKRIASDGIDRRFYKPFLFRVGTLHMKGILFEGSRYKESKSEPPDFDPKIAANFGGIFADVGPWFRESAALNRQMAPGEVYGEWNLNILDPRRYAFRHGSKSSGVNAGTSGVSCRGHVAFFDTRVELLDDAQATRPDYWFPTATILNINNRKLKAWNSTIRDFPNQTGASGQYNVP